MFPSWVPTPLPGNEDTFRAFQLIQRCRQAMGVGFDWKAVEGRLRLHGLWTAEVERGLDTCEAIMVSEEMSARKKSD